MSIHAPRLSRIFTPTYAARINAQIAHQWGKTSKIVDSAKLTTVMAWPLQEALNHPLGKSAHALGATFSYGMITESPFQDYNSSTANEYVKATGNSGLLDSGKISDLYKDVVNQAKQFSDK